MFSRRSVATLAVVVGLLAAAAPAGATVTMLDYEGSPVVTDNKDPDKLSPRG